MGKLKDHNIKKKAQGFFREWSTLLALIVLWIVLSIASPYFFTASNFSNIFVQNANKIIIAMGLTFVLITGEIDLSLGSIEALSGAIVAVCLVTLKMAILPAMLLGMLAGLLCGTISGVLRAYTGMPTFVATLAMDGVARGLALIITGGTAIFGFPEQFKVIGQGKINGVGVPIFIFIAIAIILFIVLKYTRFGVNVYATGGNAEAAELSGINVKAVKISVMMMAGFLASIGGIIMTSRLNSGQATIGEDDVMDAIAGAVIGGTSLNGGVGSIKGTLIGMAITASIRNGLNILGVSTYWQQVLIGLLIIVAVLIDQAGKGSMSNKK